MENPSQVERVFAEALALSDPDRAAYLDEACQGNEALRAEIESLLAAHADSAALLETSPVLRPDVLPEEQPGEHIGRYKLLQKIGEGGYGVVYMAEQTDPVRRRVAVKVIKLGMDTKTVVARFDAERQALALMEHPNIARVLDGGATSAGRPYFVMELVHGVPITRFCDQHNLSAAERIRLFIQVCHAVQHAHQKGVIHRDLKPSNILVAEHDGAPLAKVIDFGVAKATQGRLTEHTLFTAFEQFVGTPAYTSPEQATLGSDDIDTRSDIYSLGVLLYELLTGRTPFDAKALAQAGLDEARRQIREVEPPRPSTRLSTMDGDTLDSTARDRSTVPPKLIALVRGDLDWIVMRCLEKDRRRRYETANDLALDLQRHLEDEPVTARPPTTAYRFRKTIQRHKLAATAIAAVTLSLLTGLGVATWSFVKEKAARERAVAAEQKARSEAKKSEQVAKFLQAMLQGIGPSVALGRDTTLLREIADKTAARLETDLSDQPEVAAELRATLGKVYYELGEFERARLMFEEALRLGRNVGDSAAFKSHGHLRGSRW